MSIALTKFERKIAVALASVFATRLLGLFLIMPVFAIYGQSLQGYSPLWVGIAIGAYGLTQAVMQVPMGMASDRFGRKPVIYAGLILFFIGSVTSALADSVYVVALGRALQGVGAISSVILALAADLTREEQRTKVMAMIGMFIGVSFAASLVIGPALAVDLGLSGLFWCTALLALVGVLIVWLFVPDSVQLAPKGETTAIPRRLIKLARDPQLWRLNLGIFVLHLVITAVFVSFPIKLLSTGVEAQGHWLVYFPSLLLSFMLMVPLIIMGIKSGNVRIVFRQVLLLLTISLGLMAWSGQSLSLIVALVAFFTAFNYLEASLPSMISRFAPAGQKGSAMGVYASCQFFGAFCGGILGGAMQQWMHIDAVFVAAAALVLIWYVASSGQQEAPNLKSFSLSAKWRSLSQAKDSASLLNALPGVAEATVVYEEQIVYLKVEEKNFDLERAKDILCGQV